MRRHDEPNEYGFAGGATAPQTPADARPDEQDRAEAVAVPGDDLTEPVAEALQETEPDGRDPAPRRGR
ncbi:MULTISPECIES: hypothetical protein [Micromonospora]|uniref:Uncharacterized protein n=1 Tax=Micromonospora rifamycinica TaxID=291594 RepID=A0A109IIY8_9ACTN|nr:MULTISPECIES: hypothetical protein [Micromonospora]KWV31440.1 hypothetical protein AWV63_17580 [Micromonospora rifamycinica]WFE65655.1 hypothetical protein O7625_21270 [Micromonospora sp. WMMD714]SCG43090.1 hypothetical protein GA0070623_0971 [Micromonospora rifamycinica]